MSMCIHDTGLIVLGVNFLDYVKSEWVVGGKHGTSGKIAKGKIPPEKHISYL